MDNSRSGEVGDSAAEEEVVLTPSRSPAVGIPSPVDNDGVDERGEDNGVDNVAPESDALGDGSGDDGGGSGGEGPLEKPSGLGAVVGVLHEKVLRSDEGTVVFSVRRGTEGNGKPEEPPADGTEGSIKDILDKNVLGVLNIDHADLEHAAERGLRVANKVDEGGGGAKEVGEGDGEKNIQILGPKFSVR